jgi:hypothetical protein
MSSTPVKSTPPARPFVSRDIITCPDAWKIDSIGALVLISLSALAYFAGVNPLLQRHAMVQNQRIELVAARDKSAEVQQMLTVLNRQLGVAQKSLAASPLRLQPVAGLNQRLALVTDLATRGGAGLDDLQPGKSTAGAQYDALPIHVAGTGTFPAFAGLLHRLRQDFPDTALSSLEISGNPQDEAGTAKFSVELLWYTEPSKPAGKPRVKIDDAPQNDRAK